MSFELVAPKRKLSSRARSSFDTCCWADGRGAMEGDSTPGLLSERLEMRRAIDCCERWTAEVFLVRGGEAASFALDRRENTPLSTLWLVLAKTGTVDAVPRREGEGLCARCCVR